ncbi:MAG: Gfo/Idh/MocA family protein [Planctomycetota bacterium]
MKIDRRTFVAGTASAAIMGRAKNILAEDKNPSQAKPTSTFRAVQIGAQGHAGIVLKGLTQTEDCRLIAVARSMPEEPIEHLKNHTAWRKETRIYEDYRKMLDETKPDIVAVFTPFGQNGQANIEAARRGCHVISEKPLAVNMQELNELRRQRDQNNIRVTALLPMRFNPAFAAAHKAVKDGLIGEPILISAQKSYRWGQNRPEYFKYRKTYGGSILWVAIHAIDYIRYVTGLEYANVTARQAVKVHKDYPECEDCGALLFEMKNKGQATLTFDYLRPTKAPSHGDDRLRVAGDKGIVEVREEKKHCCQLITNDAPPRHLALPKSQKNAFVGFVELLRNQKTEVAIKARDAADTKKTITL